MKEFFKIEPMQILTAIRNWTLFIMGVYIPFAIWPDARYLNMAYPRMDANQLTASATGNSERSGQSQPGELAGEVLDSFKLVCTDPSSLPEDFRRGLVMMFRRELPGMLYLLDYHGNIVWHHQLINAGFKAVQFTDHQSFLCIVGTKEFEKGYGNAILELSMQGDTLLYLEKGKNGFNHTIHHEIFLNGQDEIVTLCREQNICDLRAKGGSARDTINGDGILVLNRQGRELWKWSVFDILNPLDDSLILKNKQDWMHANSISLDQDGNYLVSFYNNGQIWKLDSRTGKLIWRLGRNGDFKMPVGTSFDEAHAVHVNARGWLMLFDNGTKNKISRSLGLMIDEESRKVELAVENRLLPEYYSDRMGSVYLVGDSGLLQCSSKNKLTLLTNFRGDILWRLSASRMFPYRAEFISEERLGSFSTLKRSGGN